MRHSFRRALLVLLVCFALLFGLAACGQPDQTLEVEVQPSSQPEEPQPPIEEAAPPAEEPAPSAEEPPVEEPPLGFSPPDWMEQEITQGNAALDENFQWLMDHREEVLALLNQRLLSFREGTFEEMPNHHAPWPEDFPSPQDVNYPLTYNDYVIRRVYFEAIDEVTLLNGILEIWVRLDDQNHYMVLTPAWFGSAESNEITFGFSDSGFFSGEPTFDFDFDGWLAQQNP